MKLLVSGSRGLIGTALVHRLLDDGHDVTRLVRPRPSNQRPPSPEPSRDSPSTVRQLTDVQWNPLSDSIDMESLESCGPFDGAINLAGAGIGDRRWSDSRRDVLLRSRTDSTHTLIGALLALAPRPPVLINASAIGIYGDRGDEVLTEESTRGSGFLADICTAWEQATRMAIEANIRTVHLRSGIVLATQGGALKKQLPIFRLGLGGRLGSGKQFQSWISLEDELRIILRLLVDGNFDGPVNATTPEPVTNAEMTKTLGRALHRPTPMVVPAPALRLALGHRMANELLLGGQRVLPAKLTNAGFVFSHPSIDKALPAICSY